MTADQDQFDESADAKKVGYRHPPRSGQFRKGRSGNPKGRPKGALNVATVLSKTLREKVIINEHGQRKTVTKLQAAIKQLVNKAASGDLRALRQLVELACDAEAKENVNEKRKPVTAELDEELMRGILERFQGHDSRPTQQEGVDTDDDQRN